MSVDKRFYENVCDCTPFKPMTAQHSVLCTANIANIFETKLIGHEKIIWYASYRGVKQTEEI